MHKFIFILLLLFVQNSIFAQVKINGVITSKSGETIPGVNVILSNKNQDNILAYTLSGENGYYTLEYKGHSDSLKVSVTGFDYGKITKTIVGQSQRLDFQLSSQPIVLNEVIVRPDAISQRGDTISYMVSSFSGKEDRVIADVLKKMPGIEVQTSGKILYNGKEINKFYVENLDLLQGRYGIATKNISANDVASVQVYENHEPVKALQKVSISENAAINIKLKEGAKGTLSSAAQLGLGLSPLLWENELVALYFAKKYQNISTYKGNNTGNDVSGEFTSFYDVQNMQSGNLLSITGPSRPSINQQRYLFNSIHSISTNNILVLKNDYTFNANINYYNDEQTQNSYSKSSYFLPGDSVLKITEQLNLKNRINKLNADIKLNANKDNFYFDNHLRINGVWNVGKGNTYTSDTINQKLDKDTYDVSNTFKLVKTFSNGNILNLHSFNGFSHTPQNLTIQPGLYDSIFNNGQAYDILNQGAEFNNFISKTSVFYTLMSKRIKQSYYVGLNIENQDLSSQLTLLNFNQQPIVPNTPDSLQNDVRWTKYKPYVTAIYGYHWNKLKIDVIPTLSYNLLTTRDKLLSSKKSINKITFTPSIHLLYSLNNFWDITAKYYYMSDFGTVHNIFSGYMMQTYRNFNKNEGELAEYSNNIYMLGLSYRNTKRALFGNINFTHGQYKSNLLYSNEYVGILQVRNSYEIPVKSKSYILSGSVSKNIYAIRSTITLSGNYSNYKSSQIIQNQLTDYENENYGFRPNVETQISSWGSLSYTLNWTESINKTNFSDNNLPTIRSVSNHMKINLFPTESLSFFIGYENYYNSAILGDKNKSFADIEVKYKIKDIEILCTWSNIFNSKQFITASYSEAREYYYAYNIRPSQVLLMVRFKLW